MLFSNNILKRFINIKDPIDTITDNLILKTVEVEEVTHRIIPKTVVIGKIIKIYKHPDADKLNVCEVNCGSHWNFEIVCGGENVAEWIFVCVALSGTFLEKIDLKIQARNVRWIESNGMICAKAELGINEDSDLHTIWNLEEDLDDIDEDDLWKALSDKFPRLDNTIIDVDNKWLTHRPDLTGHFGMATELNAIYYAHEKSKIWFNKISQYYEQFGNSNIEQILSESRKSERRKIVCETDKLNTYILMEINNIAVSKSDFFSRLEMIDLGLGPLNNWVDFSNLFMNTAGQPIHFFDADKIEWNIIVRNAKAWEKFVDLFEKEHELLESDMVITDEKKILAIAWVVGGLNSWVDENTKNILLEVANFDAVSVRKTWVRLGLRTDSELRYEKNINPVYSLYVLILFLDLMKFYKKDLDQYEIWGLDYYVKEWVLKLRNKSLDIDFAECANFIFWENKEAEFEKFERILKWLWYRVNLKNWKWMVNFPIRRSPDDMNIKQDIFEEIARVFGYENVNEKIAQTAIKPNEYPENVKLTRTLEEILTQQMWFSQVETYPWVWEKEMKTFETDLENIIKIKNPINVDQPFLRDSIIYPLMEYVKKNSKFFDEIRMFDIGRTWTKSDESDKDNVKRENEFDIENLEKHSFAQLNEAGKLAMINFQKNISNWENDNLIAMKADIENIFVQLGIKGKLEFGKTSESAFHPKKQWKVLFNKKEVWFIGTVHPLVASEYKINEKSAVAFAELNIEILVELFKNAKIKTDYETLQNQIVWRDLCFVVDESEDFENIVNAMKKTKWVEEISVFDLYKWENLSEWKKSIALKFKIKWENMTTENINKIMDNAIQNVEKTWAKLR